jgi:hypothetical protein
MSGSADHLVVPFSVFLERREHLRTLAAGLRERAGEDAIGPAAAEKKGSEPATRAPRSAGRSEHET